MIDTIKVACECGKHFVVKSEHAGKRLRCKVCGAVITIPRVDEAADDPAPIAVPPPEPAPRDEAPPAAEPGEEPAVTPEPAAAPTPARPRPAPRQHLSLSQVGGFEPVDPSALLARLGDTRFPRTMVIAFVLLGLLVAVTSIGFISLCVKYQTIFPMVKVAEEAKAAQEVKDKEEREKVLKKFQPPAAAKTDTQPDAAKTEAKPDQPSGDSKIEKTLRETSTDKPKEMTLDLGSPGGLE